MARNHSALRRAPRLPLLRQQQLLLLLLSAAAAPLWAPGAGLCLAALQAAAALAGGRTAAGGGRPWQPSGGRSDRRASLVARRQQPEGFDGGLQGLGLQRLGYGKYKGRTYEDILRSDPEFCKKELLKADFPSASPSLRSFTAWLRALQGGAGAGAAALPPFSLQGHLLEADQQIEFGMYQGKSFQEVLDKDPEYCGWVLAQAEMDDVNPSLWLFADWLQEKEFTVPTVEAASQLTFGKHRGKSFQDVLDQYPGYCAWVLAQAEMEDATDSLLRFADWLQEKEFTVPTAEAVSQITFGKHKGKSFQEVLDQDPQYCAWVLAQAENEDAGDSISRFADWLQDKEFTPTAGIVSQITFGKHRGKSFQEVLDQDPDYCKWVLAEAEKEDASYSLLNFADWLQDKEFTVPSGNAASQITFGKHRGKSFQEVLDEDPDYCEWVLRRAEIGEASPSLLQLAGWLEATGFTASAGQDSSLVAFDKRRGNAFQEVPAGDSLLAVGQQQSSGGRPAAGRGRGVVRFDR